MKCAVISSGSLSHLIALSNFVEGILLYRSTEVVYFSTEIINETLTHKRLVSSPIFQNFEYKLFKSKRDVVKAKLEDLLFKVRFEELSAVFIDKCPELIVLDSMNANDLLILKSITSLSKSRIVFVETGLLSDFNLCKLKINYWNWNRRFLGASLFSFILFWYKRALNYLVYFGFDDLSRAIRRFKQCSFEYVRLVLERSYCIGYSSVPEFVMSAREYDLRKYTPKSYQFHIHMSNFYVRKLYQNRSLEESVAGVKEKIAILLYFGSIDDDNVFPYLSNILSHVYSFFGEHKEYFLFTVGLNCNWNLSNVFHLDHLDFSSNLSYFKVLITHGGLNSIKEAVESEVPILSINFTNSFDHSYNTYFVVEKEFGYSVDSSCKYYSDFKQSLLRTIEDVSRIKLHMRNFNNDLSEKYSLDSQRIFVLSQLDSSSIELRNL